MMMTQANMQRTRICTDDDRDTILNALLFAYHHTRYACNRNESTASEGVLYWRSVRAILACGFELEYFKPQVFSV